MVMVCCPVSAVDDQVQLPRVRVVVNHVLTDVVFIGVTWYGIVGHQLAIDIDPDCFSPIDEIVQEIQ